MKTTYFTPGPSQLYFTLDYHVRQAHREQIGSITPDSLEFERIYRKLKSNLQNLLQFPESHHLLLTFSENESRQTIIQNLAPNESFHIVGGPSSQLFFEISQSQGSKSVKNILEEDQSLEIRNFSVPKSSQLIVVTQNEAFQGSQISVQDIYSLSETSKDTPVAVDLNYSVPFVDIDFSKIDCVFFSGHHGFGLPAGLGVILMNERCVNEIRGMNLTPGPNSILLDDGNLKKYNTDPPNITGMYLLMKVAEDMIHKGIDQIRRETEYKAAVMYHLLDNNPTFHPVIRDKRLRSKTVIVAETDRQIPWEDYLSSHSIKVGLKREEGKNTRLQIANFPTHSKESFEHLADLMEAAEILDS